MTCEPIARKRGNNCDRRTVQNHRLLARLAVRKIEYAALKIHFRPSQIQYLAKAAASEQQKPDRSEHKRGHLDLLGLWLSPDVWLATDRDPA